MLLFHLSLELGKTPRQLLNELTTIELVLFEGYFKARARLNQE